MPAFHRKSPRPARALPRLWLMTDERMDEAALLQAVARLPKGSGVVFRHYRTEADTRRRLYERVRRLCRARRLVLVLAGPPETARAWRADGVHLSGARARTAGRRDRRLMRTAPAHDARAIVAAERGGVDAIFLSPVYPTRSHPGGRTLGRRGFAALARGSRVPVIALGGMTARRFRALQGAGAAGWAGIDGPSEQNR